MTAKNEDDASIHLEDNSIHQENTSIHQEDNSIHQEDNSIHQEDDHNHQPNSSIQPEDEAVQNNEENRHDESIKSRTHRGEDIINKLNKDPIGHQKILMDTKTNNKKKVHLKNKQTKKN